MEKREVIQTLAITTTSMAAAALLSIGPSTVNNNHSFNFGGVVASADSANNDVPLIVKSNTGVKNGAHLYNSSSDILPSEMVIPDGTAISGTGEKKSTKVQIRYNGNLYWVYGSSVKELDGVTDPTEDDNYGKEPAASNNQPAASNDQPAASDDQPAASDDQPAASDDQPSASDDQLAASGDQPSASDDQPAASDDQPAASDDRTAASNEQPTASDDQPATSNAQPAASNNQAAAASTQAPVPASANSTQATGAKATTAPVVTNATSSEAPTTHALPETAKANLNTNTTILASFIALIASASALLAFRRKN
ncbi:hypothetical protein [Fructobacillus fructosus]|uniref:hypothetical protein n=1 Tax=Fructobacillus fructosus TaxID=1631 RepID=UPI002DA0C3D6|nr:unnamed protein product [Fructobacillus fructosus]CAK1245935.1 unnamed protein product [Fructobacillus fructosus]CAK1247191.1 unnamed protein product [Fructobacillus fructosus]